VDIFEEGDDVVVAELPGMNKENIDVSLSGDAVTISGKET
jgi:HSP20 family molecular chaperone IbpA